MLKAMQGQEITLSCDRCGTERQEILPDGPFSAFLPEFDEYENFSTNPCTVCGEVEVFNMNIPDDEQQDEALLLPDLPLNEEVQRYYVRLLQRMGREDWNGGTGTN